MRRSWLIMLVLVVGCGGGGSNELQGARDVTAVRIDEVEEEGYVERGPTIPVEDARLDELRAIVGALGKWPDYKCIFDPGIRIAYTRFGEKGTVEICFSCGEVAIERGGRGSRYYLEPIRPRVVAWAKAMFLEDAEIQALE